MDLSYVIRESHWRSASKGVTYRVLAAVVTTTASFLLTGSVKTAAIIGSVEVTAKVLLYWAHERVWARITWGRHHKVIFAHAAAETSALPLDAKTMRSPATQKVASPPIGLETSSRGALLR
jgi:uncharacterized membrane protein